MLLQALVACVGVTVGAVATALGIELRGGAVAAEGDLDFRCTLAVAKDVPIRFQADPDSHFVEFRWQRQSRISWKWIAGITWDSLLGR
jgi:hypothetical protein